MGEIGHHLRNTVKLLDYLFIGAQGARSPLADFAPLTVSEIVGAKSELWTRFLPGAISEWKYGAGASVTIGYTAPTSQELRSLIDSWLESAKKTIKESLPTKLGLVGRGADLHGLRCSLGTDLFSEVFILPEVSRWGIFFWIFGEFTKDFETKLRNSPL